MKLYSINSIKKYFNKNRDLYLGLYLIIIKHRLSFVYIYSILSSVQDSDSINVLKSIVQMFDRFYDYISNVDLDVYSITLLNNSVRMLYTDLNKYKSVLYEDDPVKNKIDDLLAVLINCLSNYDIEEVSDGNK